MSETIIAACTELLRTRYIFPDKAEAAAARLETSLAAGDYDGLDDAALSEKVTTQLYAVCADKHLRLRPHHAAGTQPTEAEMEAMWAERLREANYGVAEVKRLDGNVGYLDLRLVTPPEIGAAHITAAMQLVGPTRALVIDLRRNAGGSPDGVQFWCSYFFDDSLTHLNSIFDPTRGTKQFWVLPWVPGDRYLDRPVWVLTSERTFSGGEEFAYNLQALKRATLVGETTGGGAHPTEPIAISTTLELTVPVARSINPVTETNWEGVGVVPDIALPAADAFTFAYKAALAHIGASDAPARALDEAKAALDALA